MAVELLKAADVKELSHKSALTAVDNAINAAQEKGEFSVVVSVHSAQALHSLKERGFVVAASATPGAYLVSWS